MKLRESAIQSQILDWLAWSRIFHRRKNTGAVKTGKRFIRFGKKGDPDIEVVYQGFFIAIEVKAEGERQTKEQCQYQRDLEEMGRGRYILAYSLEDVKKGLGVA